MARRHRLRIAGLPQHVIQRGNNRSDIFRFADDYEAFLAAASYATIRHPAAIHAYVLMKNHVHLLMTPRSPEAIAKVMQSIGLRYAQYFNRRHGRTGALFEGRYRSTIIDTEAYWFTCMRYVEFNPVRAGLVSRAEAYPWSSYASNGFGIPDRLITPHPLYQRLGDSADQRQRRWREMCAGDEGTQDLETMRRAVHCGGSLGSRIVLEQDPAENQS